METRRNSRVLVAASTRLIRSRPSSHDRGRLRRRGRGGTRRVGQFPSKADGRCPLTFDDVLAIVDAATRGEDAEWVDLDFHIKMSHPVSLIAGNEERLGRSQRQVTHENVFQHQNTRQRDRTCPAIAAQSAFDPRVVRQSPRTHSLLLRRPTDRVPSEHPGTPVVNSRCTMRNTAVHTDRSTKASLRKPQVRSPRCGCSTGSCSQFSRLPLFACIP